MTEACGMGIALSGEKESLRERVGKCAFLSLGDSGFRMGAGTCESVCQAVLGDPRYGGDSGDQSRTAMASVRGLLQPHSPKRPRWERHATLARQLDAGPCLRDFTRRPRINIYDRQTSRKRAPGCSV